ncbi:hypothetical protein EVA_13109 [gut metagenome]|uniref:Uncharacterized protein n=1 Tax=gut metagenome TaxID=749906 RepID=J9CFI8_9ZZZZ
MPAILMPGIKNNSIKRRMIAMAIRTMIINISIMFDVS